MNKQQIYSSAASLSTSTYSPKVSSKNCCDSYIVTLCTQVQQGYMFGRVRFCCLLFKFKRLRGGLLCPASCTDRAIHVFPNKTRRPPAPKILYYSTQGIRVHVINLSSSLCAAGPVAFAVQQVYSWQCSACTGLWNSSWIMWRKQLSIKVNAKFTSKVYKDLKSLII